MRSLPESLQSKLSQQMQTVHNDADPRMEVVVARARTEVVDYTYWTVETIRETSGLGDVSVAPRRFRAYGSPNRIYGIHVHNGEVKTLVREYPDRLKDGWKDQFSLGAGSSVGIAFDGRWERFRKRWRLVTHEVPWIFWVDDSNVLWRQLWDDETTKVQIDTNVVRVRAIRAWKNVNRPDQDQGVIAGYVKTDGTVWYKNYCQQIDFTYNWEMTRQVEDFTGTAVNLNMFITNDYRMGFIIEDTAGQVHWLITPRNWGGMAVESEKITATMQRTNTTLIPIDILNAYVPDETVLVESLVSTTDFTFHDTVNKILWIENIDDGTGDWGRKVRFETKYPLYNPIPENVFMEDAYFGMVIPVGTITHEVDNIFVVEVSQDTLVGMNNAHESVRLTIQNLRTKYDVMQDNFSIEFTPVNLVPVYIPLPEVTYTWNE